MLERTLGVLQIIKVMLKAGVMGECKVNEEGTPQGGLISPLLANAYLDMMDEWITGQPCYIAFLCFPWNLLKFVSQEFDVLSANICDGRMDYRTMGAKTDKIPVCTTGKTAVLTA